MPSNATQLASEPRVVAEVMDLFYPSFSIFPLRCCLENLATFAVHSTDSVFDRVKSFCRESTELWTPDEQKRYHDDPSQRPYTMQERRSAVKLINILNLTAMKKVISSTTQFSDMEYATWHGKECDKEARALRILYGSLPAWQKELPAIVFIYLRTAVKALQRRIFLLSGNKSGFVSEVWSNYIKGSASIEIDGVCNNLEKYFNDLRDFVMMNCYLPDIEDTELQREERKKLHECLKICRKLLHCFNDTVPIVHALDENWRSQLQDGWVKECGQDAGWVLRSPGTNENGLRAIFSETSHRSTASFFTAVTELSGIATEVPRELNVVGSCQISVFATAQLACSEIAKSKLRHLSYFGRLQMVPQTTETQAAVQSPSTREEKESLEVKPEMVRNNHLQVDILSLWTAIT